LPLAGLLPHMSTLFDMPGHGRSPAWDGVTDYQTATCAMAEGLTAPGAHVIGHSFGATVALRLACTRPDLVSRLTLIEPVFFAAVRGTSAFEANQRAFAPFATAMQAGDRIAAARAFLSQWGQGQWEDLSPRAQVYVTDRIKLIPAAAPAIEQDNVGLLNSGLIEGLRMPVTLISGANSPPVIAAIHAELARRIPQARIVTIPDAGHMVPVTHPKAVGDALA
jgi:lipase